MNKKTKLTSVKILTNLYHPFKKNTVNDNMNLQKLVNRCVDLYNNDSDFMNKVKNHTITEDQKF